MNASIHSLKAKLGESHQLLKSGLYEFLCRPPAGQLGSKTGHYLALGMAYVLGLGHWVWLIHFGNVRGRYLDWQKFYEFYGVARNALLEKSVPYFMPYFHKGTNQYLAIPETDLSPSLLLLGFLNIEDLFLVQMMAVYSLGFLGCLWLKRKYHWSLVVFGAFFLLFNFNGHITSHLAVGHWPWIAYFLLPFFVGWVLGLVEGNLSLGHACRLGFVLFGILLLGGLHPFVWCLLFLALLGLFKRQYWKPIATGVGLALIFSTYRILPAAVTFWDYKNPFLHGFTAFSVFESALTRITQSPEVIQDMQIGGLSLPWWEVDHYISILGVGFLIYFGLWSRWWEKETSTDYRILNIPMLLMTVFSFGALFGWIAQIPLPLISVERTPSRFLILPLLVLLALSCIWMQKWFNRMPPGWGIPALGIAGLLCEGKLLMEHSSVWYAHASRIKLAPGVLDNLEPMSAWAQSMEIYYVPVVQTSYLISLIALTAFFAGAVYFKMNPLPPEQRK